MKVPEIVLTGKVVLVRKGKQPSQEQAVLVADFRQSEPPAAIERWLNPCKEVHKATEVELDRRGCIMGFAEGLLAADCHVVIQRRFKREGQYTASLPKDQEFVGYAQPRFRGSAYWFIGLAWALGEWKKLKDELRSLKDRGLTPDQRLAILETTAQHYGKQTNIAAPLQLYATIGKVL